MTMMMKSLWSTSLTSWIALLLLVGTVKHVESSASNATASSTNAEAKLHRLLHRLHKYSFHPSEEPEEANQRFMRHLNQDMEEDEEDFTQDRSWTIGLTEPPVWLCTAEFEVCQQQVDDQQDAVLEEIRTLYPTMQVMGQLKNLVNVIQVKLPYQAQSSLIANLTQVDHVQLQQVYSLQYQPAVELVGGTLSQQYCLTGQGVKVGIMDSGVDYTHSALGGTGTVAAFTNAYGSTLISPQNTQRDGLFPTSKVVDGYDFLGEDEEIVEPDDDPIDAAGHGTAVASAILSVAPRVTLVAAKVCTTTNLYCPDFALLQGMQFMMDPNGDGSFDDAVDVINLSVAVAFSRPYHDYVARAIENVAQLNVVVVSSFGNYGNYPFIAGALATTPNTIAVAATNLPTDGSTPYMESYSARGPGEANLLKPELSAPGNLALAAAGTGNLFSLQKGTSFSAPLVTGAVALLRQQCRRCEPLAVKSILMNSADPDIMYSKDETDRNAPVTRMGSGMLRVDRALNATLWAFSLEERQPALTFGIVNANYDTVFSKTIQIRSIDTRNRTLSLGYEFRDPSKEETITITYFPPTVELRADCNASVNVQVYFYVHADIAPENTMTTSGYAGYDPAPLDLHEFDGHLVIGSEIDQDARLPFHMILRRSAAPRLQGTDALASDWRVLDENVTIFNDGLGTAQIDAYELIYADGDDPEPGYSVEQVTSDLRTIGYRTIPVGEPDCDYSVEFSFQTWERTTHVSNQMMIAEIIPEGSDGIESTLFIPPFPSVSQSFVLQNDTGNVICTGLPSDHCSNTGNTIMRACSNDLLLEGNQTFQVRFSAFAYPLELTTSTETPFISVSYPNQHLFAYSYDIPPRTKFEEFHVSGVIDNEGHGLQLVTNAYRNANHTGGSTWETEVILLLKRGIVLETEQTVDYFRWPGLYNQSGPTCGTMLPDEATCEATTSLPQDDGTAEDDDNLFDVDLTASPVCPPSEVARWDVPTAAPTAMPSMATGVPTSTPNPTSAPVEPSSGSVTPIWLTSGIYVLALGVVSLFFGLLY